MFISVLHLIIASEKMEQKITYKSKGLATLKQQYQNECKEILETHLRKREDTASVASSRAQEIVQNLPLPMLARGAKQSNGNKRRLVDLFSDDEEEDENEPPAKRKPKS